MPVEPLIVTPAPLLIVTEPEPLSAPLIVNEPPLLAVNEVKLLMALVTVIVLPPLRTTEPVPEIAFAKVSGLSDATI